MLVIYIIIEVVIRIDRFVLAANCLVFLLSSIQFLYLKDETAQVYARKQYRQYTVTSNIGTWQGMF